MRRIFCAVVAIAAFCTASLSHAGQQEFCAGFTEGYKSVKGDMVLVPLCPLAPMTPLGSTDFREGIKAGILAASK